MKLVLPLLAAALTLAACAKTGELDATGGVSAVRSACPIVGVPAGTGDMTLFDPPTSQAETAIDLVANMTQVRGTCDDTGADIGTTVTFVVQARRVRYEAARDVQLPYFIAVVRGGSTVAAKQVGTVSLHFDAGQPRAQTTATATTTVSRAEATLPPEIRDRLTRRRKAGDEDAAVDPLSQPEVRAAVAKASFEALVGFQLNDAQLRYNATR
ncbi:hypothetical protein [Sphingomonas rubra]|uniref:Lipoprotein n=1 Tax=Sphingomonas rubra TaxID=634430 RepID=A0A1I5UE21_9SPHN|nr:hypothetical protein [Sphingomonas rubra]SFP93512.1 hypothetical protein SAMN04488241_111105 [Sphingomonas rubra]